MKLLIFTLLFSSLTFAYDDLDLTIDPVEKLWIQSEYLGPKIINQKVTTFLNSKRTLAELDQVQKIKIALLFNKTIESHKWIREFNAALNSIVNNESLNKESIYLLLSESKLIPHQLHQTVIKKYPEQWNEFQANLPKNQIYNTNEELNELFHTNPNLETILGNEYKESIRLFVFCHSDRNYPCMKVMKDRFNQIVLDKNGEIWHQPSLALSKYGYPYNKRNGSTPAGVYTLDSVMPYADGQTSYGKNRRIIMNFIPATKAESKTKELLTDATAKASWWKQANVARDIGRASLRIHGTGLINTNPQSTYYPFMPSSGCLKNRENTYDGIDYTDQRIMLDTMMENLNLTPQYENETLIKGLLYVIEIKGEKEVTLDEIKPILN